MEPDRLSALRSEYEAGIVSNAYLYATYAISSGALSRYVAKYGWVRRAPPTEEQVQKTVNLFSFDPNEQALLSAAQVVSVHRKDVASLRTIAATLVDRLALMLSGTPLPEGMIALGSRESPADLLEKLSRVMVRTTEIERQAYGLKTFSPENAATDAQLQEELDRLTADVERIAAEKALAQ